MPALLHRTLGVYRLVDFLGAGGMGEVYRGVDDRIGRVVAVKVLKRVEPGSTFAERFRNEARIQAGLSHPHIARLYEYLEVEGRPCLVLEYVAGETLADRIARHGPLPAAAALHIFGQIVEAVAYLHGRGIVHRDLKPGNVKVLPDGSVKLLDFGISKGAATPRLTRTGDVVGTPHCLAPEQIRGHDADARTDIWALGVMLYEMVTGRMPFDATNVLDLYARISKADFPLPSAVNPAVPRRVEAIIFRCLKKKPNDRYASAEALHRALNRSPAAAPGLGRLHKAASRAGAALRRLVSGSGAGPVALHKTWPVWTGGAVVALVLVLVWAWPSAEEPGRFDSVVVKPVPEAILSVRIDLAEGTAQVLNPDGTLLGKTPYVVQANRGEQVAFVLRRAGYRDKPIKIDMNGRRSEYVFPMEKVED